MDYVIFEQPQPPTPDLPTLENPTQGKPTLEKPTLKPPYSDSFIILSVYYKGSISFYQLAKIILILN